LLMPAVQYRRRRSKPAKQGIDGAIAHAANERESKHGSGSFGVAHARD